MDRTLRILQQHNGTGEALDHVHRTPRQEQETQHIVPTVALQQNKSLEDIDTKGGAETWLKQLTPTWKKLLHLIRRLSNKFGGATQDITRMLVQAVLVSCACYGAIHYQLTRVQLQKLESLYRQALRVITGLPQHTRTEELYRYCQLPALQDAILTRATNDQARRLHTPQGQRLLEYDDRTFHATTFDPMVPPRQADLRGGGRQDGGNLLAIASTDTFGMTRTQCLSTRDKISPREVELQAILLGIRTLIERTPHAVTKATILTDSLEALKALRGPARRNSTPYYIKELCKEIHRNYNIVVQVQWIPGHSGNAGNEEAHRLARETLLNHPSESATPTLRYKPPPEEQRMVIKYENKQQLRNTIPPLQRPIPRNIPRERQKSSLPRPAPDMP
ncbi:hypothetical protein HPB47_023541 [Ixodes persulcatus]|uniref:Uncharacterized protein n=1 Tax=Ixodes persulcatus TaxID=34615 RepID=A0AC60Q6P4_IXOPE|nr:hypothetical protein HPB47_023541 [Ixodes persulcatus]